MKKSILFLIFLLSLNLFSQERTSADKIINEIQQIKQTEKNLKLVWWIPTEYWRIAIAHNKNVTEEQVAYIENLLDDYTLIAAGDYSLTSNNGQIDFKVINIGKKIGLYDSEGKKIPILKDTEIDNVVVSLIDNTLKPLFAQMLGKMGTGIDFFIYPNKDKAGKRLIDPTQNGNFKVVVHEQNFEWNLPLVSLIKEKRCLVDNELLPGNYIYCPFHGNKL